MSTLKNTLFTIVGLAFVLCSFYACARIGSPQGGAYDYTPPRYVTSTPHPNEANYTGHKVEIIFDELISIEKPMEKVIITPPQKKSPVIKAIGKKISVELKDTLKPNTTYTFDFTDGIVDNNEKNVLENFSFAFSTGEIVDSMIVSGILLNAENLEPMPNIMIGLYTDLSDTAFTSLPFERTTKTNDKGQFWVRNVAPGAYHIFALNDLNRDYHFDQPGEEIAFYDSLIVPGFVPSMRQDTTWKDSLTVDTIMNVKYNRFTPDDIRLFLFKEKFERQYLSKTERTPYSISFQFNSTEALPPEIFLLNVDPEDNWGIPEYADNGKTITYWIRDSLIYKADTLQIEVNYFQTDSLNKLVQVKDTMNLGLKRINAQKKKKDKKNKEQIDFLGATISTEGAIDVFDTVKVLFSEPLMDFDAHKIKIEQKVDTLWEPREFPIVRDSLNPRLYYISRKWNYGEEFQISIDSAAFYSMYGKWNDKVKAQYKIRTDAEYGHLYLSVAKTAGPGFGELLDNSDKVVRRSDLQDGELSFSNLKPGKYYLRYIEDLNGNGKWDPGNYVDKRHAEAVYYYPGSFEIKQNWEIEMEQAWDIKAVPIERQKPMEITKNKPVEKKKKKVENTNSTNSNRSGNNNSNNVQGVHSH